MPPPNVSLTAPQRSTFDGVIRRMPKKVTTCALWLACRGSAIKKMNTKMLGTLTIAGLIAMSALVGTTVANSVAWIKAYNKSNQEATKQQI